MASSAHPDNFCVLLTGLNTYLSTSLAREFLAQGLEVYAVARKAPSDLVSERAFTLIDLDLAQPLPQYLPRFDLICHLLEDNLVGMPHSSLNSFSASFKNILNLANDSKIALLTGIRTENEVLEKLPKMANLKIFLVGDIYGPDFAYKDHRPDQNMLTSLIAQAVTTNKIILDEEGREPIYPTYIEDAILAFTKFLFKDDPRKIRLIISQEPTNTLEAAYEIQSQAQKVTGKIVELFFKGHKPGFKTFSQPEIRISDLGYRPKVTLEEGLRKTFERLKFKHPTAVDHHQPAPANQNPELEKIEPKFRIKEPRRRRLLPKLRAPASRKIILLALLILLLVLAKTVFDLSVGISSLNAASASLTKSDFTASSQKSQTAARHFLSASQKIKIILAPVSIFFPNKTNQVTSTIESAKYLADSLNYFSQGAQSLVKNLRIISQPDSKDSIDPENAIANFQKAYFLSNQASVLASKHPNNFLISRFGDMDKSANDLAGASSGLLHLTNLLPDITGQTGPKTYLVLVMDNWQLRPGGGFIKAYGLLQFEKGRTKSITFDDTNKIDANLKEKIEPPLEYTQKLGVKQLFLRDSNTSPDFAANAALARDLFTYETGKSPDGVIAIDIVFFKDLLKITGPIKFDDGQQVSAENLDDIYLAQSANASLLPKLANDLFNQLNRAVIAGAPLPYLDLFEKISTDFGGKHLLVDANGATLSPYIKIKNLNNTLPPPGFDPANDRTQTRDFLAISEANLGANEVNKFIERKMEYQVDVGSVRPDSKGNNFLSKLKITYTNKSQSPDWPQGTYVTFLKVYVPQGSSIIDYQQDNSSQLDSIKVETQGNLTAFATFLEVPPQSTRTAVFTYSIGKNLSLEIAPAYHLYIQKQPGTLNDPLTFTLNLPAKVQIESVSGNLEDKGKQNYKTEKDLSIDREFDVNLIKH